MSRRFCFLSLQFSGPHQSRFTSQSASVTIVHFDTFCERFVAGARWVFSFQRVLLPSIDLCFLSLGVGPGLCRSPPDSAVKLGYLYGTRQAAVPIALLLFRSGRTPRRSPTADAAAPPIFSPRPPPLVS